MKCVKGIISIIHLKPQFAYGDIYPVTPLGKILGAMTAIIGIGLIVMPAGILPAAFCDAMQEDRKHAPFEDCSRLAARP